MRVTVGTFHPWTEWLTSWTSAVQRKREQCRSKRCVKQSSSHPRGLCCGKTIRCSAALPLWISYGNQGRVRNTLCNRSAAVRCGIPLGAARRDLWKLLPAQGRHLRDRGGRFLDRFPVCNRWYIVCKQGTKTSISCSLPQKLTSGRFLKVFRQARSRLLSNSGFSRKYRQDAVGYSPPVLRKKSPWVGPSRGCNETLLSISHPPIWWSAHPHLLGFASRSLDLRFRSRLKMNWRLTLVKTAIFYWLTGFDKNLEAFYEIISGFCEDIIKYRPVPKIAVLNIEVMLL